MTHDLDTLRAEERRLPWVKVEKPYVFERPDGECTLADLFHRRSQPARPGGRLSAGLARCRRTHAVRRAQGLPPLPFGATLHLGEILWGNIGAADRLDFTAIGPAVNLVSRLEGLCRPLGRSVLISSALAAEATMRLLPLGEHALRGIAAPCAVFTLPDA